MLNIHFFVLQNPVKQAQETQSSTAELIKGLVQLVPITNTTQLSQEAMEVSDYVKMLESG